MKAAVCEKPEVTWPVGKIKAPQVGPNDVLIKIHASGGVTWREKGRWSQNKENEMLSFL
jgi:hypothetical protein